MVTAVVDPPPQQDVDGPQHDDVADGPSDVASSKAWVASRAAEAYLSRTASRSSSAESRVGSLSREVITEPFESRQG
jgi:hypothetical protein